MSSHKFKVGDRVTDEHGREGMIIGLPDTRTWYRLEDNEGNRWYTYATHLVVSETTPARLTRITPGKWGL